MLRAGGMLACVGEHVFSQIHEAGIGNSARSQRSRAEAWLLPDGEACRLDGRFPVSGAAEAIEGGDWDGRFLTQFVSAWHPICRDATRPHFDDATPPTLIYAVPATRLSNSPCAGRCNTAKRQLD